MVTNHCPSCKESVIFTEIKNTAHKTLFTLFCPNCNIGFSESDPKKLLGIWNSFYG